MIYHHLYEKMRKKDLVVVGLIGAGAYGTAVITQEPLTPYLKTGIVADLTPEKAKESYLKAGIAENQLVYCTDPISAQAAIEAGQYVYTDKSDLVFDTPAIDIVGDSTGSPEASAANALRAIQSGKHVAMITKDCDAAVGPMLSRLAKEKGVIYTTVDGDQHGLLIQLVEWAKTIGLTVICGGKATDGEYVYDEKASTVTIKTDKKIKAPFVGTVSIREEDKKYLEMIPEGKVAEYIEKRREILSQLPPPGSYDLCEMTIAANYTGLAPQVDTLYHAPLRITEAPVAYCLEKNGGILKNTNTLDLVTCFRRPDESGLGGGVYIIARSENAYSQKILATKGQIANYDESAVIIYRPYHLCGVETSTTLLVAGLLGFNTASDDYKPRFDLVKVAARDIKAGELIENDHSTQTSARIIPACPMAPQNPAQGHLIIGKAAKVDIPKGTMITYEMIQEPESSVLWNLRRQQDEAFGLKTEK